MYCRKGLVVQQGACASLVWDCMYMVPHMVSLYGTLPYPVSTLLCVRTGTLVGRAAFFSFLGAERVGLRHANSRLNSCQSRTCSL